jgi:hypothetical protein
MICDDDANSLALNTGIVIGFDILLKSIFASILMV